jgi:hypothetical protein
MQSGSTEPAWYRALRLIALLPRAPREFYDRVHALVAMRAEAIGEERVRYQVTAFDRALEDLEHHLGGKARPAIAEAALSEIEAQVHQRIEALRPVAPFPLMHNADYTLARMAYIACRALRPTAVVETGVAYGVTSAFILKALEVNGHGELYSVDLPPLRRRSDEFIGAAIPEDLRARWRLHRGTGQRVLPTILPRLAGVGVFVQDSLHTLQNILAELRLVTPRLSQPSAVLVDDIQDNAAFARWVEQARPAYAAAVGEVEKPAVFGVAVLDTSAGESSSSVLAKG